MKEAKEQSVGELLRGIVNARDMGPVADRRVTGVFDDSREVRPGGLFIAVRGAVADGRAFIDDAIERGAAVIVGEDPPRTDRAICVPVRDARAAVARLAARWHGVDRDQPQRLKLAGVTGTNGKSTTAFMTQSILRAAGIRSGLLGTVQYDLCARTVVAPMTTPGAVQLAGYLSECAKAGASAAVMEVSSHALDQKRTDGLRFSAAAFTNLTGDHLDYHKTMDAYGAAKARLFTELDADAVAVVNRDDPAHERMTIDCGARIVYYSMRSSADIRASISRETVAGTHYRLTIGGKDIVLENAIVGRHNVYNAMAAVGIAYALGAPPEAIERGLGLVRNIPGRLQRVPCNAPGEVFVDYAHTDDALRNVLSVLRPLTRKRLIVVFGCGGDRDPSKRPRMAAVAAELADAVIVTSDNPRTEDPYAIIQGILNGFDAASMWKVQVEPDRASAIRAAIASLGRDDVLLIAGKGHEDYQLIGTRKIHFDDVEVALQAAAQFSTVAAGGRST